MTSKESETTDDSTDNLISCIRMTEGDTIWMMMLASSAKKKAADRLALILVLVLILVISIDISISMISMLTCQDNQHHY
jgi:hypothetical protein